MSLLIESDRPATRRPVRRGWPLAIVLILLSAIPLAAGALRLIELFGGPELRAPDPRFGSVPVALIVHIVTSAGFALGGVVQFLPRFRRAHREWHRRIGRGVALAGGVVACSALWLTLTYEPQPGTGTLLLAFRLVFATAMLGCLVLGVRAIRSGAVGEHRAWMTRAYAIGLGAGTQAFTEGIAVGLLGESVLVGDLAKGAGWMLNLLIAEVALRRCRRSERFGQRVNRVRPNLASEAIPRPVPAKPVPTAGTDTRAPERRRHDE